MPKSTWVGRAHYAIHTRIFFAHVYQIAPRVLHFSAFIEKSKRRRRILNELSSPHSAVVNLQVHAHQAQPSCNTVGFDSNAYNILIPDIHLEDFSLNASEKEAVNTLQDDVFMCMLLKHAAHNSQKLPNLQSLINCVHRQTTSIEESKVVYVNISSERADSRPTLIAMLSEMYKMFVIEQNQKCLLVVGDAKTYDIIKSIRAECG